MARPLHQRRRTCRHCRSDLGSLQELAGEILAKPSEALTEGERRVAAGKLATAEVWAFGVLEEYVRHAAASVEGFCSDFCRRASQRAAGEPRPRGGP